jgi:hypothetical protein
LALEYVMLHWTGNQLWDLLFLVVS